MPTHNYLVNDNHYILPSSLLFMAGNYKIVFLWSGTSCLSVTNFASLEATLSHAITLNSREQTGYPFHSFRL